MGSRVPCIESSTSSQVKIYLLEVDLSTLEHRDYYKRISTVKYIEINFINIKDSRR
jgi:hypothetical protein